MASSPNLRIQDDRPRDLNLRPTRRRGTPPIRPETIKWYYPDTREVYNEIARTQPTTATDNQSAIDFQPAWNLISRIYYSVIIQLAILRIRILADIANETERRTYHSIDNHLRCDSLPLASNIAEAISDAIPFCYFNYLSVKILPIPTHFFKVSFDYDEDDLVYFTDLTIQEHSFLLSDPTIPIRVLRWIRAYANQEPNLPEPSFASRLVYLTTGYTTSSTRISDQHFTGQINPLEALLGDPALFEEPHYTKEQLHNSISALPNHLIPREPPHARTGEDENEAGLIRLQFITMSPWFTRAKAIITAQAITAGDISDFIELIRPIEPGEYPTNHLVYESASLSFSTTRMRRRADQWM